MNFIQTVGKKKKKQLLYKENVRERKMEIVQCFKTFSHIFTFIHEKSFGGKMVFSLLPALKLLCSTPHKHQWMTIDIYTPLPC